MNKLFTKITALALGAAMVVGVGVSVGSKSKATAAQADSLSPASGQVLYTHDFSTKPDANADNTFNHNGTGTQDSVVWTAGAATNLGSYNSGNYKGVQLGTKSATGSITFTTKYDWGSQTGTYKDYTVVKKIAVWLNNGTGTISATVKVGGTACSKEGTVTKNSSATSQRDGTSEILYTPAAGHNTGKIEIALSTSSKAGYFCSFQVLCEKAASGTLTDLRIYSGESSVRKDYLLGESFDPTGLVVQAQWDNVWDTQHNVLEDVVWTPSSLTAQTTSVTGTYSSNNVSKTVTINGITVASPDFTLSASKNPFPASATSKSAATEGPDAVTVDGIEYQSSYGYVYNSSQLSINPSYNGYLGNNTAYSKFIKTIVIKFNDATSAARGTMYEGATALAETAQPTRVLSSDSKTATYTFSDTRQYFKFKQTSTGSSNFINILSIEIYLGSTPVAKVVDTVSITGAGSVYVGKTLQLTATVTYTGGVASDHNVTWRVSAGSGATVSDSGLVTATADTATTIEAKSVEKNAQDQQVTATVVITPTANPITAVAWDTSEAKTAYYVGDELDISGITATGTNAAGDNDIVIELTASNFSGFDSSASVASQTITVSYLTFSTTYSISVSEKPQGLGFGTTDEGCMKVESTNASGTDSKGNTWTITSTFEGSISFTNGANSTNKMNRSQIGSGSKHATSVTMSMTSSSFITYTSLTAKFSAFGTDTGDISMKLDGTEIATGSLNGTDMIDVGPTNYVRGKALVIEITNITRVELYSVTYYGYSDDEMVTNFVNNWMHMDYDQGGTHGSTGGNGSCKSQGWYTAAKTNYGLLFDPQKSLFNTESKYDAAKQRLVDWATANEEVFDPAAYTFTPINARNIFSVIGESVTSGTSIIIIISVIGVSALGGFFFLRKRKEI